MAQRSRDHRAYAGLNPAQGPPAATYQTRVSGYVGLDREAGDAALAAYAELYGQVERKLFADVAAGRSAAPLKSDYIREHGIPARMFSGVRVSLEGKVSAVRAAQRLRVDSLERCPASTIFAGWRQSVLPVHLLGLDALLGSVGPVAGDVKLQDDGVVHDPVNRRGGGHGVGKDALPLGEDQV